MSHGRASAPGAGKLALVAGGLPRPATPPSRRSTRHPDSPPSRSKDLTLSDAWCPTCKTFASAVDNDKALRQDDWQRRRLQLEPGAVVPLRATCRDCGTPLLPGIVLDGPLPCWQLMINGEDEGPPDGNWHATFGRGGYGLELTLRHPGDPDAWIELACEVDHGIPRFTIRTHNDPEDDEAACMVFVKVARDATYVIPDRHPAIGLICGAKGATRLAEIPWSEIDDFDAW
jgi:hypothetical protein